MPVQTDHPSAEGSVNHWGGVVDGVSGSRVAAVAANNGDTSYIAQSFGTVNQLYGMPNLPGQAGSVSSVTEHIFVRKAGTVGVNAIAIRINGNAWSSDVSPGTASSYAHHQTDWTANLTVAGVNAGESGVRGYDSLGAENRCTEIYRVTDYALAPSGFFWMLSTLLGSALSLPEFARAVAHFNAHEAERWGAWLQPSMTKILPAEIGRAYLDVTSYVHPAFCFLGGA